MNVLLHELHRLFSTRPVIVAVLFILPVVLLTYFFAPVHTPTPIDVDTISATKRLTGLDEIFTTLEKSATAEQPYTEKLYQSWVRFGGGSDRIEDDKDGAYYKFYMALIDVTDPESPYYMWTTYEKAKIAFLNYYVEYEKYIVPVPKIFIVDAHFKALSGGTERLYELFTADYGTDVNALNRARDAMTTQRLKTDFRSILGNAKSMHLTAEQVAILRQDLEKYGERQAELIDNPADYVSFCNMIYGKITWDMYGFIEQNANFDVGKYYGFTTYYRENKKIEMSRINYLLENNLIDRDFSIMPIGLGFENYLPPMHANTGTTITDYVFGATEIMLPLLLIFAGVITFFTVFIDIHLNTVIGEIASPYHRRVIIWSKIFGAFIATVAILFAYLALVSIMAGTILGIKTMFPPTVLYIFLGDLVLKCAPFWAIFGYILACFVRILLVVLFVTWVSLCPIFTPSYRLYSDEFPKNRFMKIVSSPYTLATFCAIFIVTFCVSEFFLKPFVLYNVFICPILFALLFPVAKLVDRAFIKKEYL